MFLLLLKCDFNNISNQDRVVKLTCDSILNLDNHNIRSETSFAGIESVQCSATVVYLKFKAGSTRTHTHANTRTHTHPNTPRAHAQNIFNVLIDKAKE